jgi:F1F0 ATPase subunit 2
MLVGMAMDARAMMRHSAEGEALAMLAGIAGWLAAGALIGAFHFLTLRTSARMLAAGSSLPAALALHLTRFVVITGALTVIARYGALPLLAAMLGLLAARTAVINYGAPR